MKYILFALCILSLLCSALWAKEHLPSSFRKDYFLPFKNYPEYGLPDPVNGGRFHIVVPAPNASGYFSELVINGQTANISSDTVTFFDWFHVWPLNVTEGKPLWIAFHSQDESWNSLKQGSVQVKLSNGNVAVDGTFDVVPCVLPVTSFSLSPNFTEADIFVSNLDSSPHKITSMTVNGVAVKVNGNQKLLPGETTLMQVALNEPLTQGSLWTVIVEFENAAPTAAGGRAQMPFFPIETWPVSTQCPFPPTNETNYQIHRQHFIDTFFIKKGSASNCDNQMSDASLINDDAPKHGYYALADQGLLPEITDFSQVPAIFVGDEPDDKVTNVHSVNRDSWNIWESHPEALSYVGGSRNRMMGIFDGTTDISGADMYIAACAPHIQVWGFRPPPRGSYDYMRNARDNHMPGPTWLYSQALFHGWSYHVLGKTVSRVPDAAEFRLQAYSVIAAGAKGLMYFESDVSYLEGEYAETWAALGQASHEVYAIKELLRRGNVLDQSLDVDNHDLIVQSIYSGEALVVIFLNIKNFPESYTDEGCGIGLNMHWKFFNQTVDANVAIPDQRNVVDTFEITGAQLVDTSSHHLTIQDGAATFQSIALGDLSPENVRVFILAFNTDVRATVKARLK